MAAIAGGLDKQRGEQVLDLVAGQAAIRCTAPANCSSAAEQLTQRGRARLRAGLAAGDPTGEVTAAWQDKALFRAVYARAGPAASVTIERFYRWSDGVQVPELSRLARTVRAWKLRSSPSTPPAAAPRGLPRREPPGKEGQAGRARLPQLHQRPPAAAPALRRQVANSPNRKAASSTPTLGGVALLIRRRTEQIWLVTQRPTGRPWLK